MNKSTKSLICLFGFLILVLPMISSINVTIEDTIITDNLLLYINDTISLDFVLSDSSFGYVEFYNLSGGGKFENINDTFSVNVSFYGLNYDLLSADDLKWDNGTTILDISDINITIPPNRYIEIQGIYNRNIPQPFTTTSELDKIGSFFRDATNPFTFSNLVNKIKKIIITIQDDFEINAITERLSSSIRNIADNFEINNIVERIGSFVRKIVDNFTLNNIIIRTRGYTRNLIDSFTLNNLVEKTSNFFRSIIDNFNLNNIIDRTGSFFRKVVDNFTLNTIIDKLGGITRDIPQSFTLNNIINRLTSSIRTIPQVLTLNHLVERYRTLTREVSDTFSLSSLLNRLLDAMRYVVQVIKFMINEIPYDFSGVFSSKAFNNTVLESPPGTFTPAEETEFTDYTLIEASDNVYKIDTSYTEKPYHKFNISIDEEEVAFVTFIWEGQTSYQEEANLYVWNYSKGNWSDSLDSGSGTTDFNLTTTLYNMGDIRVGTGNVTFLVQTTEK